MRRAAIIAAALAACSRGGGRPVAERLLIDSERSERAEAAHVPFAPRASEADPAVALVGDVPILASEVAAQARARGITPRAAVDELVERELLAAEAQRRGLQTDRDVREARKPPLVEALIRRDFAAHYATPADIPMAEIKLAYQKNLIHYVADEERAVIYIRARNEDSYSAAERAQAQAALTTLRGQFPDHGVDCDAVMAAAKLVTPTTPALQVSPYSGFRAYTDPTFAAAMFGLAAPGDFSHDPITTHWGTDYVCLKQITPPKNIPFEVAEKDLRERFFEVARSAGFMRFSDRVMADHDVRGPDAKQRDLLVRRAFGLPVDDQAPARAGGTAPAGLAPPPPGPARP